MRITSHARSLVSVIVVSALLVSCGSSQGSSSSGNGSDSGTSNTLERLKARKEIRIGLEGVYPPYSFHDSSGELTGIEVEIAKKIAEDLNVKPVFIETKWESLLAGIDVGKYDIIINNLEPTDERKQKYDFSNQYARSIGKVAVAPNSPIKSLADVKGKRSAQTTTSNWARRASEQGAVIIPAEGFAQTIDLVTSGRADLTFNDLVAFKQFEKEHPDAKIRLLKDELATGNCCSVLFKKNNDPLAAAINESIAKRLADGSFAAIGQKYVGVDLTPKK